MDSKRLRATLRFDGAAWRRFAELGCVYGPEWWKRGSPPVIAAIIFAIARAQRAAVLANQRQVRGPVRGPRGWLRDLRGRPRRAPRAGRPDRALRLVGGGGATPGRARASRQHGGRARAQPE